MKQQLNNRILHLEIPDRMLSLKVSDEGFPIPWFVGYPDGPNGKADFRCMDGEKMKVAIRLKRCWLCGQPLGKFLTFPIGSTRQWSCCPQPDNERRRDADQRPLPRVGLVPGSRRRSALGADAQATVQAHVQFDGERGPGRAHRSRTIQP